MLSKCANPGCSHSFRYFHEGTLFRIETEISSGNGSAFGTDTGVRKPARHLEFFWLCDNCAATMTLTYQKGVGVTARPLVPAKRSGSAAA
ncbi:MAG: hypothetical protein LAO03_04935 [Acidobacteriia bacterium]|nr:hypothetical protein [Terriglobia bacterium]